MADRAIRGKAVSFRADPFLESEGALLIRDDVVILMSDGLVQSIEPAASSSVPPGVSVEHFPNALILPGFVDTHVHYPQLEVIGAYGTKLLDWLERYTYPAERRFHDPDHAGRVAGLFLRALLASGTTTASVYCTVHPESVDAFFAESERFNTRMIAGKVLMDRNAPPELTDTAESGYADSAALIARWHERGRQLYAITPRFAPTSSDAQLEAAGRLWREHPGTYVQTHLNEDDAEIAWVQDLFPNHGSYLDVYRAAGLTGPRAVFGHAIHMSEEEFACCHVTGSAIAHCPTSNLFLGSGLFRVFDAKREDRPVRTGIGTDVGGGTSLSQLRSLGAAYMVAAMNGTRLTASQAFFLATRGGAESLYLDDKIGSIEEGHEADLVVLDLEATELIRFRLAAAATVEEQLFAMMTLADPRLVRATFVAGKKVYDRDRAEPFLYPEKP